MSGYVIDLEALLAPLDGDGGVGTDLRLDPSPNSPYRNLREALATARAEERASETSGEAEPATPPAWRDVKRIGLDCLSRSSKDFEIAAWLAEAMIRLDGLPGLIDTTRLLTGLLKGFWEPGYPQPDEDGMDVRAAPLSGLSGESADGRLVGPLRRLPIFRRPDGRPIGLHVWKIAEDTEAIANDAEGKKRKKARYDSGVPEMKALENEARADGKTVREAGRQAREASRAWAELGAEMDARFGTYAPNTRRVAEALGRMQEIAVRLVGAIPEDAPAAGPAAAEEMVEDQPMEAAVEAHGTVAVAGPRPLRTREDAIRQLEDLAEYFRKTEPHSPLAYTLEDAVRRARMPLPDLLAEVLPDAGARKAMLTMLGIRSAES